MKHTWLLFMVIFSFCGICRAAATIKVDKIAPSYWWADMKNPEFADSIIWQPYLFF